MADDLWGDLPTGEGIMTPHALLVEQAQLLRNKTEGLLAGRVRRGKTPGGDLLSILDIIAPALDYVYMVVRLEYGVTIYPVRLMLPGREPDLEARNERELQEHLKSILRSERVRAVVGALMAQIRAGKDD